MLAKVTCNVVMVVEMKILVGKLFGHFWFNILKKIEAIQILVMNIDFFSSSEVKNVCFMSSYVTQEITLQ